MLVRNSLFLLWVGVVSSFTPHLTRLSPARGHALFRVGAANIARPRAGFAVASMSLTTPLEAKKELLELLKSTGGKLTQEDDAVLGKIDGLVTTLAEQGTRFTREAADGEWALVLTRNAEGSPSLQKASNAVESIGTSFANFDVSQGKFFNIAKVLGGKGTLRATVAFDDIDGEMAGQRISCDIVDASLSIWKLKLPLPLRVKGGWLDFLYLDEDMRITRGNRGGLFVHVRPAKLQEVWGIKS